MPGQRAGAILEVLLRVINNRGGDGLEAFAHLAERPNGRIEAILGTPHQTFERLTSDLLNVTPASRGSCSAMHKIANAIIALHKMSHHSCVAQIALHVFPELTEATSEGKNVQKLDANYS